MKKKENVEKILYRKHFKPTTLKRQREIENVRESEIYFDSMLARCTPKRTNVKMYHMNVEWVFLHLYHSAIGGVSVCV